MFSRQFVMLDGTSANSAVTQSNPCCVADWAAITASVPSMVSTASRFTIQGSNDEGFRAAIDANSWSLITSLTTTGLFSITAGVRWLRAQRSAIDSQMTVIFAGNVTF